MEELPRIVDNEKILRGRIFNVAVMYTKGRPLSFVEKCEDSDSLFKIVRKEDGLEGKVGEGGKRKSEVLDVVTQVKLRPALVIQRDGDNFKKNYPFVVILPLANIPKEKKIAV